MKVLLLELWPSKGLKDTLNICCGRWGSAIFLSWDFGVGNVKYSLWYVWIRKIWNAYSNAFQLHWHGSLLLSTVAEWFYHHLLWEIWNRNVENSHIGAKIDSRNSSGVAPSHHRVDDLVSKLRHTTCWNKEKIEVLMSSHHHVSHQGVHAPCSQFTHLSCWDWSDRAACSSAVSALSLFCRLHTAVVKDPHRRAARGLCRSAWHGSGFDRLGSHKRS